MKLTDLGIRGLSPDRRAKRYFDGKGLYIEVTPAGAKRWRWKYRFEGKEKRLSFGAYPKISLKAARLLREEAAEKLSMGIDPGAKEPAPVVVTFRSVAEEWLSKQHQWKENHRRTVVGRLNNDDTNFLATAP